MQILWILLLIGVPFLIYLFFRNLSRQKLDNEEKKIKFLESKFSYLIDKEFNEETKSSNKEFNEILKIFNDNGYKKGRVTSIAALLPYNEEKPWDVAAHIKKGHSLLLNDKEEFITIFSILDSELENLKEYKNFIL